MLDDIEKLSTEDLIELRLQLKSEIRADSWDRFCSYNLQDVAIPLKLDKKKNLFAVQMMLAYRAKINYESALGPVALWTAIIHNELMSHNIVLPPRSRASKSEAYEGAYVKDTIPGFYNWVTCFDFTSLYPTLMASHCISPESLVRSYDEIPVPVRKYWRTNITQHMRDNSLPAEVSEALLANHMCICGNGEVFRTDVDAVIPRLVRNMFADRKSAKDEMKTLKRKYEADHTLTELKDAAELLSVKEQVIKICLNSLYGAFGSEHFHLFEVALAAAITISGQGYILHCQDEFNKYLRKICNEPERDFVIAGDTDSLYLYLGLFQEKFGMNQAQLTKAIDTKFQDLAAQYIKDVVDMTGVTRSMMGLKREKIISVSVFIRKKRYVGYAVDNEGVVYAEPQFFVVGLESKRSDVPRKVRSSLEDVYKLILANDEQGLIEYVSNFRQNYHTYPLDTIAFATGVSNVAKWQNQSKSGVPYKSGTPIFVRAAIMHNYLVSELDLERNIQPITNGTKIKYVYLDPKNPTRENVIGFTGATIPTEFDLTKYIDYDLMFEKTFISPVKTICEVAGMLYEPASEASGYF